MRPTWTGFVYVAFVIDAYARRIVGWRASVLLPERLFLAHSLRPAYGGFVRVFARPAGVGISGVRRIF